MPKDWWLSLCKIKAFFSFPPWKKQIDRLGGQLQKCQYKKICKCHWLQQNICITLMNQVYFIAILYLDPCLMFINHDKSAECNCKWHMYQQWYVFNTYSCPSINSQKVRGEGLFSPLFPIVYLIFSEAAMSFHMFLPSVSLRAFQIRYYKWPAKWKSLIHIPDTCHQWLS